MSIERLKQLEKQYNMLSMPFPVITFDTKVGKFKTPSGFIEAPIEMVIVKQYSQYKHFIDKNGSTMLDFATTIEETAAACSYKGKTRDELKLLLDKSASSHRFVYQALFLTLVKENNAFRPYILITTGSVLASFINAFNIRKPSFTNKFVIKEIQENFAVDETAYEVIIEPQSITEEEANQIVVLLEPPNAVIDQFEEYRKAYNG